MEKVPIDPARSALMSRIRSKNTKPEVAVRRMLHARGFRFRLHRKDLPGKPDLVFPKYKAALFVHGCFWHQHQNCRSASVPKTRTDYWIPKLEANVKRDQQAIAELEKLGWLTEIIWECEVRDAEVLNSWADGFEARLKSRCPPPAASEKEVSPKSSC